MPLPDDETLERLADLARSGVPVIDDFCLACRGWVEATTARVCRTLPALQEGEVSHLLWLDVLEAAERFDPDRPAASVGWLRRKARVLKAEAVRAEIGRSGTRRVMSVPLEWFLSLPVEHLWSPPDLLIETEEQARVDSLLDRLPARVAARVRDAMDSGRRVGVSDAEQVLSILDEAVAS